LKSPLHPSLPGAVFVLFALAIPLLAADPLLNGDGDPARHLRHGQEILSHGSVIRADPFSFTRPGEPFVGFEYGSQVLMALSDAAGGKAGLVALATLLIAGSLSLLTAWLLRRGLDSALVLVTVLTTAVLTSVHWIARPHLVSWPLTLLLFFALERPQAPKAWHMALLFALWANLHGAFVYGWLLIGLYLTGHLLDAWTTRDRPARRAEALGRARGLAAVLPVAVAATLLNPYGWRLPWHVVEYFRDPYIRQTTQEFLSPNFHSGEMQPLLLVLVGTMAVLALLPRPRTVSLVVILAHVGMVLLAQRNVTLFALVAVPLLAIHVGPWWASVVERSTRVVRFGAVARSGTTTPWVAVGTVWLALLTAGHGRLAGRTVVADEFSRTRFPVEAVAEARAAGLAGRVFHDFMWGGYLLYAWPESRVFIDGGTDFYGGDLIRSYRAISGLQPGWRDSLEVRQVNIVLTRPRTALAAALQDRTEWLPWHCDSTAVLFVRRSGSSVVSAAGGCPIH